MYKIVDGILTIDGKKVFAVGESYYPSFHHGKYPVPPEGDRDGEMKKDIRLMKEAGINHIRFAALDKFGVNEKDEVWVQADFVDSMLRECEKNDISASVRLQGYVTNLRGHKDVLMRDCNGVEQDTTKWSDFIQTTVYHEGMLKDDRDHTSVLAKHFEAFPAVVGYQIYNEPHFPGNYVFDYHPLAIQAYRKWLVEKGYMSAEEAADYEPPRSRQEQEPKMWALFRLFSTEGLTAFLRNAANASQKASPLPTFTCYTDSEIEKIAPVRGCDLFRGAADTDMCGYTDYDLPQGGAYIEKALNACINVDAGAAYGKCAWNIELDCRRVLPADMFTSGIYVTLAAGVKGIVFYQWRGDAPGEFTPNPNSCGALNFDGTKTDKYDEVMKGISLLNRLSDRLVEVRPHYSDIAILYSNYAVAMADATENHGNKRTECLCNSVIDHLLETFADLVRLGYRPFITDLDNLVEGRVHAGTIFAPAKEYLSERELDALTAYEANATRVFVTYRGGYQPIGATPRISPLAKSNCPVSYFMDELALSFERPFASSSTRLIQPWALTAPDFDLLVLCNVASAAANVPAFALTLSRTYRSATLETENGSSPLDIRDGVIFFENDEAVKNGGIIVLEK